MDRPSRAIGSAAESIFLGCRSGVWVCERLKVVGQDDNREGVVLFVFESQLLNDFHRVKIVAGKFIRGLLPNISLATTCFFPFLLQLIAQRFLFLANMALRVFISYALLGLASFTFADPIPKVDHDIVIVGGGPAGLSTLSALGRVRRNAVMYDSGEYRNGPTRHMHDVIGNDGKPVQSYTSFIAVLTVF